jgi:hypothetical protein
MYRPGEPGADDEDVEVEGLGAASGACRIGRVSMGSCFR